MYNINKQPLIYMISNLALIIGCIILLTHLYISSGFSSTWFLILVVCACFIATLISIISKQNKQLVQVIRALANGDNSLGFSEHHPMRRYYDQVKQQMQLAKFESEHKTEFVKTLLVHIDLAVIVCDIDGKVVESNPAVARLLGKNIKHLNELKHIASLVSATQKNFRSTVPWQHGETIDTLSAHLSFAHIQGQEYKIITLQSIHETLLNREQQAYKRLTQVLTHEVANTITPLASIAQTCQALLPAELSFNNEEDKQDLTLALTTLAARTQYLGEFIASFRQVSSLPTPQLAPATLNDIIERIRILHHQQLKDRNIVLSINMAQQQLVMLDSAQIEQVLINLIKNAIEALSVQMSQHDNLPAQAQITITVAKNDSQQFYVEIADNGAGIPEHVLDVIFVPFFTTKQQGSGIGLSLSKQIMINHGGDLIYIPQSNGACFRCIFGY